MQQLFVSRARRWACALALGAGLLGCNGGAPGSRGSEATASATAATDEAPSGAITPARNGTWVIEGEGSAELVRIELRDGTATVRYGSSVLVGTAEGAKRRYAAQGSQAVEYVVKDQGTKFKLKDAGDKLLWKVKLDTDKVKLADSEEGEAKLSLKAKGDGEHKVKRGEQEIGKVTFDPSTRRVKVKNAEGKEIARAEAAEGSALYGMLLLEEIPIPQRYILMAELGARGR